MFVDVYFTTFNVITHICRYYSWQHKGPVNIYWGVGTGAF